ncbi:MAG: beta-glucanase [Lentisphaerae bacterium GWF2_50_93]|nr:MAG: beta-glucanase [Lentisphaerae bacterium GWF2_50_93]
MSYDRGSNARSAEVSSLSSFEPGAIWRDDNGVHINAHGGGVLFHEGVYYWFGEHKIEGVDGNRAQVGVHVYSSTDLYNWTDRGISLAVSGDPDSEIAKGCIIERPKVVYNSKTAKFVMWFHLEFKGKGYGSARAGIAMADKPVGPYMFLRSIRANAGHWPLNVTADQMEPGLIARTKEEKDQFVGGPSSKHSQYNILGAHFEEGQMVRDMTIFVDDDGKAYHIYASEHNSTLQISLLTDDYLDCTGKYVRVFPLCWMEAPAVCKRSGRYYLIASGCTGWAPNAARLAVAESIFGPWMEIGNPCIGINPGNNLGPEKTFGAQSTFILKVQGFDDAFIALFDIWSPHDAIDGRYVWLPVEFCGEGMRIKWMDKWGLSVFSAKAGGNA